MEGYGVGMMARSLAGHDKGKVYMVLDVKEPFVYLVDGEDPYTGSSEKEKDQTCSGGSAYSGMDPECDPGRKRSSGFGCHPWKKRIRRKVKQEGMQCLRQMLLK